MFGNENRRTINLGGTSSATTQASILDQARVRRLQRESERRRHDNAIRIQAWWRGCREARLTRSQLRRVLDQDATSINGLRCLVLLGRDASALTLWCNSNNETSIFQLATGPYAASWLVLIRQIAHLLLQAVVKAPLAEQSIAYTNALSVLLSPSAASKVLGQDGTPVAAEIIQYLSRHGFYSDLSKAICAVPVGQHKNSQVLSGLVPLAIQPFSVFSLTSPAYSTCLIALVSHVFTIPLLPNRIPLQSLTNLSSNLPMSSLHMIQDDVSTIIDRATPDDKVNLISNLLVFMPPRYAKLRKDSLDTYLLLLTRTINTLPVHTLAPSQLAQNGTSDISLADDSDSDSDEPRTRVAVVSSFNAESVVAKPSPLDARTLKRLRTIYSLGHLKALISAASSREALIGFLLALVIGCPSEKGDILRAVLDCTGGGLIRELYRFQVRACPLGKDTDMSTLSAQTNASSWPPLILLVDVYNQTLLTMGDDEFFGTSVTSTSAPRNPLSLDELTTFSRQLLNIAFTLYWHPIEEQRNRAALDAAGLRITWEGVRDLVTRCLVGIHGRDSRKPFMPKDHWLVTSNFDVPSFVEAAIFEEQQLAEAEASPSVSRRNMSARQVAYLSPRLGILNNLPFAVPFALRVSIFRAFVLNDKQSRGASDRYSYEMRRARTLVRVRRGHVSQDGFDKLSEADLKAPIEITFIDQFGQEEAGIDGGGVFKEFLTSLSKEVFDTDRGLWLSSNNNELYPNPHAYATDAHSLAWFRFIGRILGKALYEGILLDVAFAGFFLAKWLKKRSFLDDLASLDPDLYNGLIFLKHYEGNPEDLSLNFTITVEEFGDTKTIDLVPNGSNIPVTRENRLAYITLVADFRLTKQIKLQSEAFFEGLSDMVDPKWLRMFNQHEVQILLGGVNSPIDVDDLRNNAQYGGLYDPNHPTIVAFWNVVETFDHEQRRALLRFVTSCSRPPLLGFKELVPHFAIRDAGSDIARLPTSSTCVNLLKLPLYPNAAILREKLLKSITSGAGFDLS
ncbi:hypothetical protein HGRIS_006212 [Hohenbuehelia grisea]|uniref:HECT-type E3 ubiquitin transferase n=1 Tax=Hohenbuehelia grisea TaxID=104357 RepID=A0ABR3JZ59_9AGAR